MAAKAAVGEAETAMGMIPALVAGKWPRDLEIELFHAMCTHEPAGVNRHFEIVGIFRHLQPRFPTITIDDIWAHLNRLYDLESLEERKEAEDTESPILSDIKMPKGKDFIEFDIHSAPYLADLAKKRFDIDPDDGTDSEESTKSSRGRRGKGQNNATSTEIKKIGRRGRASAAKTPYKKKR